MGFSAAKLTKNLHFAAADRKKITVTFSPRPASLCAPPSPTGRGAGGEVKTSQTHAMRPNSSWGI